MGIYTGLRIVGNEIIVIKHGYFYFKNMGVKILLDSEAYLS